MGGGNPESSAATSSAAAAAFSVTGDQIADEMVFGTTAYKGAYSDTGSSIDVMGDTFPVYANGSGWYVYAYAMSAIPYWAIGTDPASGPVGTFSMAYGTSQPAAGSYEVGAIPTGMVTIS